MHAVGQETPNNFSNEYLKIASKLQVFMPITWGKVRVIW